MESFVGLLEDGNKIISQERIASLWAGYGSIYRLKVQKSSGPSTLVVKQIKYNDANSGDEGHMRKLLSYKVEEYFYEKLSKELTGSHARVAEAYNKRNENEKICLVLEDLSKHYPISAGSNNFPQSKCVLKWLANFHACFWERKDIPLIPPPLVKSTVKQGVWQQGGYWYLDTRQDELSDITGREWSKLKAHSSKIDKFLKGQHDGTTSDSHFTLLHGDAKSANILFSSSKDSCAMYDFQYVGRGYGVKDVVYFLATSCDSSVVAKQEKDLIEYYHQELMSALRRYNKASVVYTIETLNKHFEYALLDWTRFCAGWGMWGNVSWLTKRANKILDELD
ncbi:hypothetical protein AKO1_011480 [Acrasis kona]|uniref:CHK kinase-like domain-containing protein n=1 Tax=Acrasis kona TaxID=1008807 RepID=A0AAW2Z3B9_9EUKA